MPVELTEQQHKVLSLLQEAAGPVPIEELAARSGIDQAQVAAVALDAERQGWISVQQRDRLELSLVAKGEGSLFPEQAFIDAAGPEPMAMQDAARKAAELGVKLNEVIKWGTQRGWLRKDGGQIALSEEGLQARHRQSPDALALSLVQTEPKFLDELEASAGIRAAEIQRLLGKRPEVARLKPRTLRLLTLTAEGRAVAKGPVTVRRQQTQLTTDDITSGAWRQIDLKPYDVTLSAETAVPVKLHPFQRILEEVRRAFLEMGFTEVVSPMVETAFWDFDALYQPQDHPARDMQDTFYLERPGVGRLPDASIVERVRRTHEDGWVTGSTGWGYRWSEARARQMVLRTHTTSTSIRALAQDPNPPRKVFCVGRVFRNENITYKNLPEFTQVDGIVIDRDASFATLLGTLREFYRKMGFEHVKFKPEFFPYTEPSAGVFVYMESKKRWLELGGSGVFRPEVTRPLGCEVPVLAWGLGLERLAMARYGVQDIRTLYWTDLDWLKEVPLCQ
jgi:phenylalanyl-tRNA synthetase alpha chain